MRYFDLHCDTAGVCFKNKIFPDDTSLAASVNKSGAFDEWRQCFAVFVPDDCLEPESEYRAQISDFKVKIARFDNVVPYFTLENALPVKSVGFVDVLVRDGIRAATLTWNGENQLAGGADTDVGLKPLGKEIIERFNKNRIAVDL